MKSESEKQHRRPHRISYRNALSDWSEALPLGNGHFGGMGYLDREDGLVITFNHYDVYYRYLANYSRRHLASGAAPPGIPAPPRDEMKRRALEAHADPNHPGHNLYTVCYTPELASTWGVQREGQPMAIAGSLRLLPRRGLLESTDFLTELEIETATFRFSAGELVDLKSWVALSPDVSVTQVRQSRPGAFEKLVLSVPVMRGLTSTPAGGGAAGDGVFYLENTFFSQSEDQNKFPPFRYLIAVKVLGANARLLGEPAHDALEMQLTGEGESFTLLVTVLPPDDSADLIAVARERLNSAAANLEQLETNHTAHWRKFFSRSRVALPDPMLETLWYLHLYALACCSGEGAALYREACGLNGLWDIKGPTQWGSNWYWDVNIEQSFWPVFASNHLELARVFHRGLLAWVDAARAYARDFHKLPGLAGDYPFAYYLSMWPWCAQYFWWHYTHSLDEAFLRDEAYPLFKEILEFFQAYAEQDPETGKLLIFPDVAPEQGPLTRNSMSTLSCLKFLLRMTIESSRVLKLDEEARAGWEAMLATIPEYASDVSRRFGPHFKDSEWAEGLLFLAHHGILKPIYPIREMTRRSEPDVYQKALGTLRYADALSAYSTHTIWSAAAAATLGLGDEAVRMLYDRGIAQQMRPNGMIAEETDRYLQACLTNCAPVYNPPLVEGGSTIVATINEMLLHSFDGKIELFPAVPKGEKTTRYREDRSDPPHQAAAPVKPWLQCSFENLLAEGAFEVSAWLCAGKVARVRINSQKGGTPRLIDPFPATAKVSVTSGDREVSAQRKAGEITFETQAGASYEISAGAFSRENEDAEPTADDAIAAATTPLCIEAPTRRRVFLGKDEHTEFYLALDAALHDYYAGHLPQSKSTVYKFDFTPTAQPKDYFGVSAWQWHVCGKQGGPWLPIGADPASTYHRTNGRGWKDVARLICVDRNGPDALRRDFVTSDSPAEFQLELIRGDYQITVFTGDPQGETHTQLASASSLPWDAGPLSTGRYAAGTVLLSHPRDGLTSLRFSAPQGARWNVAALIINRIL